MAPLEKVVRPKPESKTNTKPQTLNPKLQQPVTDDLILREGICGVPEQGSSVGI